MNDLFTFEDNNVFEKKLVGLFGHFKTFESYDLYYLMTSINISRLKDSLHIAADALDFTNVDFDELIQRDIDYTRVEDDIVENYLKAGKNKVLFFPPLIVTLLATEDGKPVKQYMKLDEMVDSNYIIKTWDNKFRLKLPIAKNDTANKICASGKEHSYINYAATIEYNPNNIKVVAIDGQHRLAAIKMLAENEKDNTLDNIDIPICVFFTPDATIDNVTHQDLRSNMRELFITINKTSRNVSGHFLVLLNDHSLSSLCVRDFANKLKGESDNPIDSKLHILEWNQREERKANQLDKPYSITTVSIIASALDRYVFTNKDKDRRVSPNIFLKLSEIEHDLAEYGDDDSSSNISEGIVSASLKELLLGQVEKYITPSLYEIFTSPSFYKKKIDEFKKGVEELDDNTKGTKYFKENILFQFRKSNQSDPTSSITVEEEFNEKFKKAEQNIYYRNVFQTGLIGAWCTLINELAIRHNLDSLIIAKSFVNTLDGYILKSENNLLDNKYVYNQNIIYDGVKIKVTEGTKDEIANLLLGSFISDKNCEQFINELGHYNDEIINKDQLKNSLTELASYGLIEFFETYQRNSAKTIKNNWRFMEFNSTIKDNLEVLEQQINAGDKKAEKELKTTINSLAEERTVKAKEVLANILEIDVNKIM